MIAGMIIGIVPWVVVVLWYTVIGAFLQPNKEVTINCTIAMNAITSGLIGGALLGWLAGLKITVGVFQ